MTTGKDVAPAGILRYPDHPCYITIVRAGSGWDPVMFWWNPQSGGYWEPWSTGGRFVSEEAAAVDGRAWAQEEGMPYRAPGSTPLDAGFNAGIEAAIDVFVKTWERAGIVQDAIDESRALKRGTRG